MLFRRREGGSVYFCDKNVKTSTVKVFLKTLFFFYSENCTNRCPVAFFAQDGSFVTVRMSNVCLELLPYKKYSYKKYAINAHW